jgi:hypothetical protein
VEVYLFSRIQFSGIVAGSTVSRSKIYLTFRSDIPEGATRLEARFYAEHAATLLKEFRARFPAERWNALNPEGFTYGQVVGRSSDWRPRDMREGFLCEYARTDIEADAKMIGAELFLNKAVFQMARRIYPGIDAKAKLMTEFYNSLDPRFTAEYFAARPNAPGAIPLSLIDLLNAAESAKKPQ